MSGDEVLELARWQARAEAAEGVIDKILYCYGGFGFGERHDFWHWLEDNKAVREIIGIPKGPVEFRHNDKLGVVEAVQDGKSIGWIIDGAPLDALRDFKQRFAS